MRHSKDWAINGRQGLCFVIPTRPSRDTALLHSETFTLTLRSCSLAARRPCRHTSNFCLGATAPRQPENTPTRVSSHLPAAHASHSLGSKQAYLTQRLSEREAQRNGRQRRPHWHSFAGYVLHACFRHHLSNLRSDASIRSAAEQQLSQAAEENFVSLEACPPSVL